MFSIPDTLGEIYSFFLSVINKTGKSTSSGKNEMFIFQQLLYFITYLFSPLITKPSEIGKVGYILDLGHFHNDAILELGKNIIRISICGYIE